MTTIDTTISDVLDRFKPDGAKWAVLRTPDLGNPKDDQDTTDIHGPFDTFDEAFEWALEHGGQVHPLFSP